jgi:hypothetical protein
MATADDVRRIATTLPRTVERLVRDTVRFNVGRIVYLSLSRDEQTLGFAFPKDERAALVGSEPEKFSLPGKGDMRWNWVHLCLAAVDEDDLHELVLDAWRMVVPKSVAAEYERTRTAPSP